MTRIYCLLLFFFFKQKTAYEMRISDLSSDVCSSDLRRRAPARGDALYRADLRSAFLDRPRQNLLSFEQLHREPDRLRRGQRQPRNLEIGRASCRERVCQYVYISVVAVSLKQKIIFSPLF